MTFPLPRAWRWVAATAALVAAFGGSAAIAQIPQPPSTIFGSISDSAGPVPEGLPVQAYVGDKLCTDNTPSETKVTGDGDARVTVDVVNVLSGEQTAGCGKANGDVRIKVGDRFATTTAKWQAGAVRLDITFGNATPAPIPTFTPVPTPTKNPNAVATNAQGTPIASASPVGTIPAGSPGAGSPIPTLKGGVTNSTPGTSAPTGGDDGGGFPLWGVAVLVLGGIALVGGGVGFAMSRNRDDDDDDLYPPPPDDTLQ
jgi:hypothetical protein